MSYLNDTFLGAAEDDPSVQVGNAGSLAPMTPDGPPKKGDQVIILPGGITLPRQTAMVLLAVIVAVAIYFMLKRKKPSRDTED